MARGEDFVAEYGPRASCKSLLTPPTAQQSLISAGDRIDALANVAWLMDDIIQVQKMSDGAWKSKSEAIGGGGPTDWGRVLEGCKAVRRHPRKCDQKRAVNTPNAT